MSYPDLQTKVYNVFDRSVTFFYSEDHKGGKIDVSQWSKQDIDALVDKLQVNHFDYEVSDEFVFLIAI